MDPNHVNTEEMMITHMQKSPKILHRLAGKKSCCIFRVPPSLAKTNKEAYQPRIVSIGPYHHGNKDLEMLQEHKWRFLHGFLERTGKSLGFFLNILVSMENEIRQSYSESIEHIRSNDLIEMMVLDGVFLIELFRKVGKLIPIDEDDPIFSMLWVRPLLERDLLMIENQIPFFVLQKLFDQSRVDTITLPPLVLLFFSFAVNSRTGLFNNCGGQHLLDLFRKNTLDRNPVALRENGTLDEPYLKIIEPATKLDFSGVKFMANHGADSFLDIMFRNGVLSVPQINMDDFFTCFLSNAVAFEQCYANCSKEITIYVVLLGCLIHNSSDVGLLSQSKIIKNHFGTDKEVVKFFNDVGKDLAFDINHNNNYLKSLFVNVNKYCSHGET